MKPIIKNAIILAGACLLGAAPPVALAKGDGATSLYVEDGDAALLYEGQMPPGAEPQTNPFKAKLSSAHMRYVKEWSGLPAIAIPAGRTLTQGSSGERVALLRQRLGLPEGRNFDAMMAERVRLFRQMHGLGNSAKIDGAMLRALQRGPAHYERILKRNLDHADELPAFLGYRYVHVDLTNQRLQMIEDGKVVDEMAVVAGKASSPTPVMAGLLRHAVLSPYWNVPPDLVRDRYAKRIINGGKAYLARTGFEVLSDFTKDAHVVPASSVDWHAVDRGELTVRLRQKPGPGNGMGKVKFMFPNSLGIYLHDTASKQLFTKPQRLFSAGCVRVERPQDIGAWLFNGQMPSPSGAAEEEVNLPFPVPIYITYFTAQPDFSTGVPQITYRDDIYSHDKPRMAQLSGN